MLSLRRDVSICLANGHSQARLYSLIMLRNEAEIIRQQKRQDFVLLGILMKTVENSCIVDMKQSDREKMQKELSNLLDDIQKGNHG